MLLITLAARNATRNVVRTGLTALIVVAGTAFLVIALSWMNGVFGSLTGTAAAASGHVRLATAEYVKREDLLPLYENIPDVDAVVAKVKTVPGVEGAFPRITCGVTLTAGDEIGEVFGLAVGAPQGWYDDWLDLDQKIVDGRMMEADDEVVLGQSVADRVGAKVGTDLVILGQTQDGAMSPIKGHVVGIARAGNAMIDQEVFLTLPRAQYMVDLDGGATEVVVYGADRNGAVDLRDAIAPLEPGLTVQAWSDREPWHTFVTAGEVIRGWLQGIIVFITALGVWNTMMMSVLERTGEIGVMRAMGLTRWGAVALFVVEALAIAVIGGVVGVAVGAVPAYYLEVHGVALGDAIVQNVALPFSSRMHADFSVHIAVQAFFLALAMALVGSAPPAWHAASIQPVAAMRSKR